MIRDLTSLIVKHSDYGIINVRTPLWLLGEIGRFNEKVFIDKAKW